MSKSDTTDAGVISNQLEDQNQLPPLRGRKPLIDYCKNEWASPRYRQGRAYSPPDDDLDDPIDRLERIFELVKAPKIRRALCIVAFAVLSICILWTTYLNRLVREERVAWTMLNKQTQLELGYFGSSMRAQLPGLTQVASLDPRLLPSHSIGTPSDSSAQRRLIFIGDIHGCMDELSELLEKVGYDSKRDHIITTGDMINKGPKSLEVVDYLRRQGASCVRGNHEDRILLLSKSATAATIRTARLENPGKTKNRSQFSEKNAQEHDLAESLTKHHRSYLNACPVILKVGEVKAHGEVMVAHGGMVPGIAPADQDPGSVMNMRNLDLDTLVPLRNHKCDNCVPWAKLWNSFQRLVSVSERVHYGGEHGTSSLKQSTVVYGHDSRRGLQLRRWTKGIDSGCFRGGKLSAWILSDGGKEELVQVQCKDHRAEKSANTG